MSFHDDECSDHVHNVGFEGNEAVPISNPDDFYDRLDRRLSGEDAAGRRGDVQGNGFCARGRARLHLQQPGALNVIAGRALAFQFWLAPTDSRYQRVSQIAADCGLTKAALSKAVLQFADAMQVRLPVGKRKGTRQSFRDKQLALVAEHRHASDTRKRAKTA
jgi:hypothetical protein